MGYQEASHHAEFFGYEIYKNSPVILNFKYKEVKLRISCFSDFIKHNFFMSFFEGKKNENPTKNIYFLKSIFEQLVSLRFTQTLPKMTIFSLMK